VFSLLKIELFSPNELTDVKWPHSLTFQFRSCCMTLHILR